MLTASGDDGSRVVPHPASRRRRALARLATVLVLLLLTVAACGVNSGVANQPTAVVPTETPTPSCTPSPTPTATPTPMPPSPTATPKPSATATPKPSATPKPKPTATPKPPPAPWSPVVPNPPITQGKLVLVDLSDQWLFTYQDGRFVFANAVETGMPDLPTPIGRFSVLSKQRDITFVSPWPEGSPYWYAPTHINYAMLFREGGFYLHDAWWHVRFGPGGNVPHQLPDGRWETGSHGCVGMTIPDAQRLYNWVLVGTPVIIRP